MKKLISLMTKFGAEFFQKINFFFLYIFHLQIILLVYHMRLNLCSTKSSVILAGLNSYGETDIIENLKSRDHTENMLKKNKHAIRISNGKKRELKFLESKI